MITICGKQPPGNTEREFARRPPRKDAETGGVEQKVTELTEGGNREGAKTANPVASVASRLLQNQAEKKTKEFKK